jgi:hypothetical protein
LRAARSSCAARDILTLGSSTNVNPPRIKQTNIAAVTGQNK